MKQYDLLIIGAGSAGVRLARRAAEHDKKVALIESQQIGGTCVNRGCVPKKLLVAAASGRKQIDLLNDYGWKIKTKGINWKQVPTLLNTIIQKLHPLYMQKLHALGVDYIEGEAVFQDRNNVLVNDVVHQAENIVIATGGKPSIPLIAGLEKAETSDTIFACDKLPKNISIIGGGYIAVEFAGIFNALGVDTKLIYRGNHLLRHFDLEIVRHLETIYQKNGVQLFPKSTIVSVIQKSKNKYQMHLHDGNTIETSMIFAATGRVPNTKNLNLSATTIDTTQTGGIKINEKFQTSVPNIYALGDVIERIQLTPVAIAEAELLCKILYQPKGVKLMDYNYVPTAVFSQPELASVGKSEAKAIQEKIETICHTQKFVALTDSVQNTPDTILIKIVAEKKTSKVLGLHMVGSGAAEIVQMLGLALKKGLYLKDLQQMIGVHPSTGEEFFAL